eukprot:scaffold21737_cov114-Isochrysis_galbana.AAC.5
MTWIDTLHTAEEGEGWRRVHPTGRRSGRGAEPAGSRSAGSIAGGAAPDATEDGAGDATGTITDGVSLSAGAIAGGSAGGGGPTDCGVAFFARLATGVSRNAADARRLAAMGLPAVGDGHYNLDGLAVALFGEGTLLLESARELLQSLE